MRVWLHLAVAVAALTDLSACVRAGFEAPPPARVDAAGDADLAIADGPRDDGPPADTKPVMDGPPPTACKAPASPAVVLGSDMVICDLFQTAGPASQCDAAQWCAASNGWSMCTASQYRARWGLKPPVMIGAWIKGCIRDGVQPFSPVDNLCTCAVAPGVADSVVTWSCASPPSPVESGTDPHIGLTTGAACRQAGEPGAANEGFWQATPSTQTMSGVLCCRP